MLLNEIFTTLAIALTLIGFIPYIRSIYRAQTRPHVFSWIIWGSTTFIVFLAQMSDGAGMGSWPIGLSGIITLYVAYLAYAKRSDTTITRADWIFLTTALLSIPIWYFTDNALWAVLILTAIDLLGFGPTIRKSYFHPFDEDLWFFLIFVLRNILVIFALEHYSMITVIFPASISVACIALMLTVLYRRKILRAST